MKYRELVLDKVEKITNALSTLQAAVSSGNVSIYEAAIERINTLLGDVTTFVSREEEN